MKSIHGSHLQSDYINGGAQRRTSQQSLYFALLHLSLSIYLFVASKNKKKTCEEKWQKKEKKRKARKVLYHSLLGELAK